MKSSLLSKLSTLADRHQEIEGLMSVQEVISDQSRFRALAKEHAEISPIIACYEDYRTAESDLSEAEALSQEDDAEMRAMAQD